MRIPRDIVVGAVAIACCSLAGATLLRAADYVVRADDKLKIRIFQFPELSGEYTVSATGMISIPPMGELSVSGLSASGVSKEISSRFIGAGISDKPGATVEVLQSRPIYVLGDVQRPGEYTYRHGVTVLQAISLAGGWFRINDPELMRLDREAITINGDMRNLLTRYYHLVAEQARLSAELVLSSDVEFPIELTRRAQADRTLAQLLDEERSFLRINVKAFKSQLDSLDKTRSLYEKGIEAVSSQIQANHLQSQSIDKELGAVKGLLARGLSPISPKWNLERMQSQVEIATQGYQTIILRAQQNITEVEQKLFELKNDRQARLTKELQQTRLNLDEVAIRFDTSRKLMAQAQLATPRLVSDAPDITEGRSLTVVRLNDGKAATIDADENTELLPGDVLKVEKSVIPAGIANERLPGPGPSLYVPASGGGH